MSAMQMATLLVLLVGSAASPGGLVPNWPGTYNMSLSTVIMPCNNDELMSDGPNWPVIRSFGLIDIDWSNSKAEWINARPMSCEQNLLRQAQLIKADNPIGPGQRIWVYRNPVLAMPWMAATRRIMDDPAYDVWFLKFRNCSDGRSAVHCDGQYKNPVCDRSYSPPKCSELFHSQIQTMESKGFHSRGLDAHGHWFDQAPPDGLCSGQSCDCGRVPCGMYLFDHRQGQRQVCTGWGGCLTLRQWFISNLTITPTGLLSPAVDGFYIDDSWPKPSSAHDWPPPASRGRDGNIWGGGAGDLDGTEIEDCGLSFEDATGLYTGWVANMKPMVREILANGGFIWQMTNGGSGIWAEVANYTGTGSWSVSGRADCASTLRDACRSDSKQQQGALIYQIGVNATSMQVVDLPQHLASFLLIRGKFAWFGYGWLGCSRNYSRPAELDVDYGVPLGVCEESAPGVFRREWSKASVRMDCNTYEAEIIPKAT